MSSPNAKLLALHIAVVGLGYVGLPLARAFGQHVPTLGFDKNPQRIQQLQHGLDTNEVGSSTEAWPPWLAFSADPAELGRANVFIVAVPTPVDAAKRPDLSHLREASCLVARALASRQLHDRDGGERPIVVYESTVYPGCTEEFCVPILERESRQKAGRDFAVGYSPERVNPGDPEHTLEKVIKIVAAQDPETLEKVASVYSLVAKAGIYRAPDIKTAEAAKVIENIQRDLNIALMNELSLLFHRFNLDTREVLKAARTKWNFLPFEPGLVGGHCIPVDPYYLTYKAEEAGYHPELVLAGRRTNDAMGVYVARQTVRLLIQARKAVHQVKVLVLGVTFKENVRDARNSRVLDLVRELEDHHCQVLVYDPLVLREDSELQGLKLIGDPFANNVRYDAVVLAVPHEVFRKKSMGAYLRLLASDNGSAVLVDVKGVLPWQREIREHGVLYWSL